MYLCVLCGSENKQRLFPCTALTDWFLSAFAKLEFAPVCGWLKGAVHVRHVRDGKCVQSDGNVTVCLFVTEDSAMSSVMSPSMTLLFKIL